MRRKQKREIFQRCLINGFRIRHCVEPTGPSPTLPLQWSLADNDLPMIRNKRNSTPDTLALRLLQFWKSRAETYRYVYYWIMETRKNVLC
ncbi:hypothetical protein AVEN_174818-1 [Araneus ventricosus]|uniref:Uncharacterized protein n=2 Tax=Araneus ventricosus TaxID=182803 RepID=A0A4Y2QIP8_ARAVE|nr:hypothetical protein AVEN_174818-1 [Araneus ventricosus]